MRSCAPQAVVPPASAGTAQCRQPPPGFRAWLCRHRRPEPGASCSRTNSPSKLQSGARPSTLPGLSPAL
eukprot:14208691-Alexandrium_andersonii.AAC.1